MRFKCKEKPKKGDKRVIPHFAFKPLQIENEIYLFETVFFIQEFAVNSDPSSGVTVSQWLTIEKINKEAYAELVKVDL